MVGMNLATSLAVVVAAGLAASMIRQLLTRPARRAEVAAGPGAEHVAAVSPGSRR
jgi:Rod binding domain-containing protein